MKRAPIVYFLPMHRFVIECSDGLLVWIHSWWLKDEIINKLSSKGWYSQVFDRGFFVESSTNYFRCSVGTALY